MIHVRRMVFGLSLMGVIVAIPLLLTWNPYVFGTIFLLAAGYAVGIALVGIYDDERKERAMKKEKRERKEYLANTTEAERAIDEILEQLEEPVSREKEFVRNMMEELRERKLTGHT